MKILNSGNQSKIFNHFREISEQSKSFQGKAYIELIKRFRVKYKVFKLVDLIENNNS